MLKADHPLYRTWKGMIARTSYPTATGYEYYGGRGITVCSAWAEDFFTFVADMGPRPEGMTLDRIDNDGNYIKENCRWATRSEQADNTSRSKKFTYDGEQRNLTEISSITGISRNALEQRLAAGCTPEQAFSLPIGSKLTENSYGPKSKLWPYKGQMLSLTEIAKATGISRITLVSRLTIAKLTIEEATSHVKYSGNSRTLYPYKGEQLLLKDLAAALNLNRATLASRLKVASLEAVIAEAEKCLKTTT